MGIRREVTRLETFGTDAGSAIAVQAKAPSVVSRGQVVGCVVALAVVAVGLVRAPVGTLVIVNALAISIFAAGSLVKLFLVWRAGAHPELRHGNGGAPLLADADLPVYTVLLPVYREAALLRQLVAGIAALDYPLDRLDVKLLFEEDDAETLAAAEALDLPSNFELIVVPDVGPRGKPRACNVGLVHAKGDLLVIYDAEDRPEPDQLRKAASAFHSLPRSDVVCLQAKLNYFNRTYNLLTRLFTAEYSLWFDLLLPGLQSLDAAIPLGGTSNHFRVDKLRELGGWNAYNVTEDAELGVRIFLAGWKTEVLDSTTYEEANSRYGNWLRQRSRWVKGYMQTYLLHMRHPVRAARTMGGRAFTMFQLFFGAGTLCLLINPIYWVLTLVWYLTKSPFIEHTFPWPVLYLGTVGLLLGNAAFIVCAMAGCYERRNYGDVKWALLMPFYWLLMSVAAWKALIQLCYKPSYWEKTIHGYCVLDEEATTDALAALALKPPASAATTSVGD
jgi:cellulose synthase/poly-beta-1,6-N-acetylglucosamine synthase-like glycosyltransferase